MTPDVGSLRAALETLMDAADRLIVASWHVQGIQIQRGAVERAIHHAREALAEPVTPEPDNPHPPRDIAWGMSEPAPSEREAQIDVERLAQAMARLGFRHMDSDEGYYLTPDTAAPAIAAEYARLAAATPESRPPLIAKTWVPEEK